jgi:hypothetical protein
MHLINLPNTLKYLEINDIYNKPLESIIDSNIEEIYIRDNKNLSILEYIPKKLNILHIIQTHCEIYEIENKYPVLIIDIIPDYDYQDKIFNLNRYAFN